MRTSKCECVCSFGIIGMMLCTVLIGFSTIEIVASTVTMDINQNGMNLMYDDSNFVEKMMKFFDSTTGMIVLLASFASMILGMWYRGKIKLIPVAAIGATFMFAGMYHTYSLEIQIIGVIIMALTYIPMYSFSVSKILRL